MMATDGSSPGLGLGTVQFDLDDLLHVRLIFGLSKLNFRFAGLQNCRIALRLRCNACTISSRLPTCSLWLANFLLGITVGLGVGVHAEITKYFDNTCGRLYLARKSLEKKEEEAGRCYYDCVDIESHCMRRANRIEDIKWNQLTLLSNKYVSG